MDTKRKYIFVHGTAGWGSYDARYEKMPYWGMRGGDMISYLREKGFDCYAASVSPVGSAWDRACELYAQICGSRVDYGQNHSVHYSHERYGKDFTECPLFPDWSEDTELVLIGHSFGGATVRLFAELMAHGDEAERSDTKEEDLSPLFAGGKGHHIVAVVGLASEYNGNSVYDMTDEELKKIGSAFGVGMGCLEATCGALIGAQILMGMKKYQGKPMLGDAASVLHRRQDLKSLRCL